MRSDRVAHRLLQRGLIQRRQFDDAVRAQGFFGGELESHLLTLGHVTETALGEALSEIYELPYASAEQLRAISDEARKALPRDLLEQLRVCPFQVEGGTLRVAVLQPRDRTVMAALERASRLTVEPWVTCEYRLYRALERHWRIRPGGVRAIALAPSDPRLAPSAIPDESPAPESTPAEDGQSGVGLDGLPLDLEHPHGPVQEGGDWSSTETARRWLADTGEEEFPAGSEPEPPSRPRTTRELGEALSDARNRDEIAAAVLGYALGRAARAALFAVGKDGIRGVEGSGRGMEGVRRITVRPGTGTVFDLAGSSGESYAGSVPPLPANRDLYTAMGGRLPRQIMLVPISVKGRLAAFLYMDGDDAPLERPDLPTLRRVAAMAGLAFEFVLLRNKLREG